jgi:hypothetical protein
MNEIENQSYHNIICNMMKCAVDAFMCDDKEMKTIDYEFCQRTIEICISYFNAKRRDKFEEVNNEK